MDENIFGLDFRVSSLELYDVLNYESGMLTFSMCGFEACYYRFTSVSGSQSAGTLAIFSEKDMKNSLLDPRWDQQYSHSRDIQKCATGAIDLSNIQSSNPKTILSTSLKQISSKQSDVTLHHHFGAGTLVGKLHIIITVYYIRHSIPLTMEIEEGSLAPITYTPDNLPPMSPPSQSIISSHENDQDDEYSYDGPIPKDTLVMTRKPLMSYIGVDSSTMKQRVVEVHTPNPNPGYIPLSSSLTKSVKKIPTRPNISISKSITKDPTLPKERSISPRCSACDLHIPTITTDELQGNRIISDKLFITRYVHTRSIENVKSSKRSTGTDPDQVPTRALGPGSGAAAKRYGRGRGRVGGDSDSLFSRSIEIVTVEESKSSSSLPLPLPLDERNITYNNKNSYKNNNISYQSSNGSNAQRPNSAHSMTRTGNNHRERKITTTARKHTSEIEIHRKIYNTPPLPPPPSSTSSSSKITAMTKDHRNEHPQSRTMGNRRGNSSSLVTVVNQQRYKQNPHPCPMKPMDMMMVSPNNNTTNTASKFTPKQSTVQRLMHSNEVQIIDLKENKQEIQNKNQNIKLILKDQNSITNIYTETYAANCISDSSRLSSMYDNSIPVNAMQPPPLVYYG